MDFTIWKESLLAGMKSLYGQVGEFLPSLVGACVIVVLGFLVSKLLSKSVAAILRKIGFDRAVEKVGIEGVLKKAGIQKAGSSIVGFLVFWLLMLVFLNTAVEALGLIRVSETVHEFVLFLPKVIGAALILVAGLLVANFIRGLVTSSAASIGVEYSQGLGKFTFGVLVVVTGTLAMGQLEIETGLLSRMVEILLTASGLAIALALGLGTRDVAKNIVSGIYTRDNIKPGVYIEADGVKGTVQEVGTTMTKLSAADGGFTYIPNSHLSSVVIHSSVKKAG